MATTNAPPSTSTQKSGGSGTYVIGVILLALAMGAIWLFGSGEKEKPAPTTTESATPPPPPPPPAFAPPPPPEIEEEDAGVDAGETDVKAPTGGGTGNGNCSNCGKGKSSPALNSALSAMAGSAKGCYNRALRTSAVSGSLTVSVQVGPNGAVCGASVVNDSVGSSEIASCVTGRFAGKQFPPPQEGCVVVNIPIAFKIKE